MNCSFCFAEGCSCHCRETSAIPSSHGTLPEEGLACLSDVFLFEGGRINWGSIRLVKVFSLIKLKRTVQGGISSQNPEKAKRTLGTHN